MRRPTEWRTRLEYDGRLVLVTRAVTDTKKVHRELDVYREDEYGVCESRNLYMSVYQGHVVAYPGDRYDRYSDAVATLEDWSVCDRVTVYGKQEDEESTLIAEHYPAFMRYVYPKACGAVGTSALSIQMTLRLLALWKAHPECELVIAAGYWKIATSRQFWRLSQKKQKAFTDYMRKHPGLDLSYSDLAVVIRYGLTLEQLKEYRQSWYSGFAYPTHLYLKRQQRLFYGRVGRCISIWRDYNTLLKQTAHNRNAPYWKYPKDLEEAHIRVLAEVNAAQERIKAGETAETFGKIAEIAAKYPDTVIDGYRVYVSSDRAEWEEQATALHQCILRCEYDRKMAHGLGDIVFIRKGDRPVATAQLFGKDMEIGQFYGDETDRHNCMPSDEVRAVLDKYIEMARAKEEAA